MTTLFIDFETFFDRKAGYDLKVLSMVEYIRDPRFKIHGVGVAVDEAPPVWLRGSEVGELPSLLKPGTTIVGHNLKFDGSVLCAALDCLDLNGMQLIDTKALARAVLGKQVEDYRLATLAKYFGLPDKGELKCDGLGDLDEETEADLSAYCLHDVTLCRDIYRRCIPSFPSDQLPHLDWTIRSFIYPKLVVNTGVLDAAVQEEQARKARVFEEIGVPKTIFSSSDRFAALLADHGVCVPTKISKRTGEAIPALSVADTTFLDLLEAHPDEKIRKLCEARVEAKSTILETRCAKLAAVGKTGAWPFDVEFSGAAQTHRYSGGSGAAGNPQNFVRDSALREAIRAPDGHTLVVGDFSAIEMRLVAYLASDPGLIRAIEGGKDVYCEYATAFYKRPITKADKAERWFGKTAILGLGYGMGARKFQHTVRIQTGQRISDTDAKRAVTLYRTKYWRVPQLWSFLDLFIPRLAGRADGPVGSLPVRAVEGTILLPSGLRIQYPNLRQDGVTRYGKPEWVYDEWTTKGKQEPTKLYGGKVLENITQALAGELAKDANLEFIQQEELVGVVHDEAILCVPDGSLRQAAERLKAAMSRPPVWLPRIKLQCEIGIGETWKAAKA